MGVGHHVPTRIGKVGGGNPRVAKELNIEAGFSEATFKIPVAAHEQQLRCLRPGLEVKPQSLNDAVEVRKAGLHEGCPGIRSGCNGGSIGPHVGASACGKAYVQRKPHASRGWAQAFLVTPGRDQREPATP